MFKDDQLDKGFILRVCPSAVDLIEELKRIVKYGPREIDFQKYDMDSRIQIDSRQNVNQSSELRENTTKSIDVDGH